MTAPSAGAGKSAGLRRVGMIGIGSYIPERRITNAELEQLVDTSDDWIRQRTGIVERRMLAPDQACSDLALAAARAALADAKCAPEELDVIVVGTVTGDYVLPATATLVQAGLGAWNAAGFDVSAACPGFIYATAVGTQFVETGRARRALVIGSEALTRIVDFTDRATCVLFGDGAGAAVLGPAEDAKRAEILEFELHTKGGNPELLYVPSGGSRRPSSAESVAERTHFLRMSGRDVYRFAVESMVSMVRSAIDKYGRDEICLVVPHQMNRRILESVIDRLALDPERVLVNIEKYGNTSSASVPVGLAEAVQRGLPVPGKIVLLCAVGAGLAWGSVTLRW